MNQQDLILMGRATAPAAKLESKAGKEFYKFSLAINQFRKNESEIKEQVTTFYNVLCFGKNTITLAKNLNKGDVVFLSGKPEVSVYESKNGELKADLQVLANYMSLYNKPSVKKVKEPAK